MPTFTQGTVKCSGCKWLCYAGGDFGMNKEYYCCHPKQEYKNIQTLFLDKNNCPLNSEVDKGHTPVVLN